jgi:hypothetical protein
MSLSPRRPVALAVSAALTAALAAATLTGCTTVHLEPAPSADTVSCADVTVHLPQTLESMKLRDTDAQATGAWGSPAAVLLTCGITTPAVSDLPCYTVDGVDWLIKSTGKGGKNAVYTTYGREPGVQVVVDTEAVPSSSNVLFDLASAVGSLPQGLRCQSASDATPAP